MAGLCLEDTLQHGEAEGGRDVGMGADQRRALRHAAANEGAGALGGGQRQVGHHPLVGLDAAGARRAGGVRNPGQAHQRLVEMEVPVGQAREEKLAAERVGRRGWGQRGAGLQDGGDAAAGGGDRHAGAAIGQAGFGQEGVDGIHAGHGRRKPPARQGSRFSARR